MGTEILKNQSTMGSFMTFLMAAGFLQRPIKKLQEVYVRIQQTIVASQRVFDILSDENITVESKDPKKFPKNWSTIRFENIYFKYLD